MCSCRSRLSDWIRMWPWFSTSPKNFAGGLDEELWETGRHWHLPDPTLHHLAMSLGSSQVLVVDQAQNVPPAVHNIQQYVKMAIRELMNQGSASRLKLFIQSCRNQTRCTWTRHIQLCCKNREEESTNNNYLHAAQVAAVHITDCPMEA